MSKGSLNSPSDYFHIEMSNENRKFLNFQREIVCGENTNTKKHIIEDTSGKNTTLRLARRKIDDLGNVKAHGCIINDENAIGKPKNRLKLAESMSFIAKKDKKSESNKQMKDINELNSISFNSIQKLVKHNNPKKLTKKEICSVLFCAYTVDMKESKHEKEEYLIFLEKENEQF